MKKENKLLLDLFKNFNFNQMLDFIIANRYWLSEDEIINIYKVVIDVNDIPIDKLVEAVIAAKDVKGVLLDELAETSFTRKDVQDDELAEAMLVIGLVRKNARGVLLHELAETSLTRNDVSVDKLAEAVINIDLSIKKANSIYKFAKDVNDVSIDKLAEAVINIDLSRKNVKDANKFTEGVKGTTFDKLVEVEIDNISQQVLEDMLNDLKNNIVSQLYYNYLLNPDTYEEKEKLDQENKENMKLEVSETEKGTEKKLEKIYKKEPEN